MTLILRNARVIMENDILYPGYLICGEDGYIWDIGRDIDDNVLSVSDDTLQTETSLEPSEIDLKGKFLAPGFIDIHTHGALGYDVMDADSHSLEKISQFHLQSGVTGYLATTMTDSWQNIAESVNTVNEYQITKEKRGEATNLLGVHLEGPFINHDKKGVHFQEYISEANLDKIKEINNLAGDNLYMISLAPEIAHASIMIKWGCKNNIVMSAAHTNATYEEMQNVFSAGLTHGSHLFNGMSGIHHRTPGAAMALLLHPETTVELIVDNKHLHNSIVDLTYQIKSVDKIALISDSTKVTGLGEGEYSYGETTISTAEGTAKTNNGQLAGSLVSLPEALNNFLSITGASLVDAVKTVSLTPAKILGISDQRGSLLPGKLADAVILSEDLHVEGTILQGRLFDWK